MKFDQKDAHMNHVRIDPQIGKICEIRSDIQKLGKMTHLSIDEVGYYDGA